MKHFTPEQAHEFIRPNTDAVFVDVGSDVEYFYGDHSLVAEYFPAQDSPNWDVELGFA